MKKWSYAVTENQTQEFALPSSYHSSHKLSPPSMNLVENHVSSKQVYLFLHACLKRILPKGLLGSKKNWRAFYQNIYHFLTLRYDGMSINEFAYQIKLSSIPWLQLHHKPTSIDNKQSELLFTSLLSFLLSSLIVSLLLYLLSSSFLFFQITSMLLIHSLLMILLSSIVNQSILLSLWKSFLKVTILLYLREFLLW